MATKAFIDLFLSQHHLALAGVSRNNKKFGNIVLKELSAKGYRISVVHPSAGEIGGTACFPSLADLQESVGGVMIAVPPDQSKSLAREAAAAGIRNIWLQKGAESTTAVEFCRSWGINVIYGECILMFARPTGVHRCQR
jgi:uncharacterized protein